MVSVGVFNLRPAITGTPFYLSQRPEDKGPVTSHTPAPKTPKLDRLLAVSNNTRGDDVTSHEED